MQYNLLPTYLCLLIYLPTYLPHSLSRVECEAGGGRRYTRPKPPPPVLYCVCVCPGASDLQLTIPCTLLLSIVYTTPQNTIQGPRKPSCLFIVYLCIFLSLCCLDLWCHSVVFACLFLRIPKCLSACFFCSPACLPVPQSPTAFEYSPLFLCIVCKSLFLFMHSCLITCLSAYLCSPT